MRIKALKIICALAVLPAIACGNAWSTPTPNHLVHEKSPYLLQHVYNPVDWYPWGREAFEKAKKEDKPILVSIGYATCHWCHVMERESYMNQETAAIMNKYLVSIKVDREERPDIDKVYMTAVSAMTGSGGWPLNVFLTPDLKPFFGGTYFPPEDHKGRPGWASLIKNIGNSWKDPIVKEKIIRSAGKLSSELNKMFDHPENPATLSLEAAKNSFDQFARVFDSKYGGFGGAPKFPMPVNLNFLLRYYAYAKENKNEEDAKSALEISLKILDAMAGGGIYDQIGGGFHRYSTDEQWRIPHFEKMLYDNAQIAVNYLDAYQITRDTEYARIAQETLDYILRDLTSREGAFFSAEDADSYPRGYSENKRNMTEKEEGAFYTWKKNEIMEILGNEAGSIFCYRYGILPDGNMNSGLPGEFQDKNLPYLAHNLSDTSGKFSKSFSETEKILRESREKLFHARSSRPRPQRDDKVLASWNGLAISAFAKAAQILGREDYLKAAERSANFIRSRMVKSQTEQLYHRWREGERKIRGMADDYAFLTQGLLDLYEASQDPKWLTWALRLREEGNKRFLDQVRGGFYLAERNRDISWAPRVKEDSDNVEPSASSIFVLNLLRLAQFTERNDLKATAEKTLEYFSSQLKESPLSLPQMLCGLLYLESSPYEILIAGKKGSADTEAMLREVYSRFIPNKIVMLIEDSSRESLVKIFPDAESYRMIGVKATAYICIAFTCKLPTNDPDAARRLLDGLR